MSRQVIGHPWVRAGLLLAVMTVLAVSAVRAMPDDDTYQLFWPSGLATAALVVLGRKRRREGLVAVAVLSTASYLFCSIGVIAAVLFGLGVALEGLVVSAVLLEGVPVGERPPLTTSREMVRFLLAAAAGAAVAAATCGLTASVAGWSDASLVLMATFGAHLASELVIVPFVARVLTHRPLARPAEHALQLLLLVAATAVAFTSLQLPLTAFTLIPLLGWGAVRLSVREALGQMAAVSVAIGAATAAGVGSFAALPTVLGLQDELRDVVASVFLIDCVLVVLPLAILAAQQIQNAREAAAERDRLESIVNGATGVAIIGADAQARITLFNPGAEAALGYTAAEVMGRSTRMFHSDLDVSTKARQLGVADDFAVVGRLLASPAYAGTEMGFVRKDGVERVHSMTLTPLTEDGVLTGLVSTSEDITDRVRAAAALSEALEAERDAVDRLREVDAVKDAFVSTVSHELRTPITSILGYVELLAEGAYGPLGTAQTDALGRIAGNSSRLLDLIDDLLILSRLQQESLRPVECAFDLREVVASGHDLIVSSLRARDLVVTLQLPPDPIPFVGDKEMVERVVVNLVGNAVKFTGDGGRVGVCLESDGDDAVLRVTDTGIGVPLLEREHLFQRFFRASTARQAAIKGTGLGLSITRAIVEQHGGSVRLDEAVEVGAAFEVRLPRAS